MVLVCNPQIRAIFARLGATDLPRLSLVTADDW
jgi:hypothetical protein